MKQKVLVLLAAGFLLCGPLGAAAQTSDTLAAKNAQQARAALDAMVSALGGDIWLNMENQLLIGQIAAFFHGSPDPGTTLAFEYHAWPDRDRIEVTKHRDVI